LRDDLSTRDVSGPFNQIASPEVLMNSGSAQKPGAIGPGYKPGVQAWYNQFLVVDPADGNHLYAGLEDVYETTDAGKSWITAAPYWNLTLKCFDISAPDFGGCPNTTHSDQHAATVANGTLWVGNDGGVFSRPTGVHTNGGSWTDHNRYLGTLQYYYADSGKDPTSGATVFCVASDFYAGGEVLWKSMSGFRTGEDDWSAQFDTGAGRSISALAVAGGNGYAAWCGPCWPGYVSETGFGRGVITNLGTGAWRQLDLSAVPTGCDAIPNRYITGIAIHPADRRHAYLSVSGYARHWMVGPDDPGLGHVFQTTDGGTCWHDISGDLVDAPANDVAIVGSRLVVADDVGVFAAGLSGGTWKRVGVGLPHTIAADLNTTPDGRLLIATHGRGLWAIPLSALG
jgi:photosystem II stability/assembly factor-like uncharacterized protein